MHPAQEVAVQPPQPEEAEVAEAGALKPAPQRKAAADIFFLGVSFWQRGQMIFCSRERTSSSKEAPQLGHSYS